jgi:membrane fusion protein (multidrug efflux system)
MTERHSHLRRIVLLTAGATLGFAALVVGVRYWLWSRTHEETDDAYVAGHIHAVSARVSGTVEAVLVDDNQWVERGQPLVRLDPHDFQVRLEQAKAALGSARHRADSAESAVGLASRTASARSIDAEAETRNADAALAAAQAQLAEADAGVPRAQAVLKSARATLRQTQQDLARYTDLVAKEQVSRQEFDRARAAADVAAGAEAAAVQAVAQAKAEQVKARELLEQARSRVLGARATTESARAAAADTEVRRNQHQAALSTIEQAAAAVSDATLQLGYTSITAPVAGWIGRKTVEVGHRVQPGQPLLAIVQADPWVVANFKETQLERMRPRQSVEIFVDSFPSHPFRGYIDSLSPASGSQFALLPPDNATGNFTKIVQRIPVKILLDSSEGEPSEQLLRPGMSAVVTARVR